jgi:hypothetical protein
MGMEPRFCFVNERTGPSASLSSATTGSQTQLSRALAKHHLIGAHNRVNTTDAIHVVWYVLDASDAAGVTQCDVDLIKEVLPSYLPVVVVYVEERYSAEGARAEAEQEAEVPPAYLENLFVTIRRCVGVLPIGRRSVAAAAAAAEEEEEEV